RTSVHAAAAAGMTRLAHEVLQSMFRYKLRLTAAGAASLGLIAVAVAALVTPFTRAGGDPHHGAPAVQGQAQAPPAAPKASAVAPRPPRTGTGETPGRVMTLRVVAAETGAPVLAHFERTVNFTQSVANTDARGVANLRHSTGPGDRDVSIDV